MAKTKRLNITVPIEIYAECYGWVHERAARHQLEQEVQEKMKPRKTFAERLAEVQAEKEAKNA